MMTINIFDGEEERGDKQYMEWVKENPNGFIINICTVPSMPGYPKLHKATDKRIFSNKENNHTTGIYKKICSNDFELLITTFETHYRGQIIWCKNCFRETRRGAGRNNPEFKDYYKEV